MAFKVSKIRKCKAGGINRYKCMFTMNGKFFLQSPNLNDGHDVPHASKACSVLRKGKQNRVDNAKCLSKCPLQGLSEEYHSLTLVCVTLAVSMLLSSGHSIPIPSLPMYKSQLFKLISLWVNCVHIDSAD